VARQSTGDITEIIHRALNLPDDSRLEKIAISPAIPEIARLRTASGLHDLIRTFFLNHLPKLLLLRPSRGRIQYKTLTHQIGEPRAPERTAGLGESYVGHKCGENR